MRSLLPFFAAIAATVVFSAIPARAAGTLELAPTTLELAKGEPGVLYIANRGIETATIQIEAYDWLQDDGNNQLHSSSTFLLSPPLLTVEPGERALVRVIADPPPRTTETAYRLIISELPSVSREPTPNTLTMLMQFSVPVFVGPGDGARPVLSWTANQTESGMAIFVRNDGSMTAKLTELQITDSAGRPAVPEDHTGMTYVLPGAERHWNVSAGNMLPDSGYWVRAAEARTGAAISTKVEIE